MPNLYIITGPAGVGKSTVSEEIAKRSKKSALIEGDDIYHQVVGGYIPPWKMGNHLQIFWKVCLNTIKTYLEDGFDVIFNYIIALEDLELIKEHLNNYEVKFVVLLSEEKTLISRDTKRPENCQMKDRCITLLNKFKSRNYDSNNILDTTDLSINDTINIIQNDNRFILKKVGKN